MEQPKKGSEVLREFAEKLNHIASAGKMINPGTIWGIAHDMNLAAIPLELDEADTEDLLMDLKERTNATSSLIFKEAV